MLGMHGALSSMPNKYYIKLAVVAQAGESKRIRSPRFDNTGSWRPTRAQETLSPEAIINQSSKQTKKKVNYY